MSDAKILGLAARIRSPIPLAALAVLSLTVVGLTVIHQLPAEELGGADIRALITTVLIALMAVCAGTVIAALIISRPRPLAAERPDIVTLGNASPGEVGGSFDAKVRSDGSRPVPVRRVSKDAIGRITTLGDASPGVVKGDYRAEIDEEGRQ